MTCQDIINQVEWDLLGDFLGIDQIAEKNGISSDEVIAIYMAMEESTLRQSWMPIAKNTLNTSTCILSGKTVRGVE